MQLNHLQTILLEALCQGKMAGATLNLLLNEITIEIYEEEGVGVMVLPYDEYLVVIGIHDIMCLAG